MYQDLAGRATMYQDLLYQDLLYQDLYQDLCTRIFEWIECPEVIKAGTEIHVELEISAFPGV